MEIVKYIFKKNIGTIFLKFLNKIIFIETYYLKIKKKFIFDNYMQLN